MNVLTILTILIRTVKCEEDKRVITTLEYSKYRQNVKLTVVNGEPAEEGQIPYLVSFKEPAKKIQIGQYLWKNLCGGSIVSERKVLTAAHCFEGENFFYAKNPHLLRVVAGSLQTDLIHNAFTDTAPLAQWRKIEKLVIHDNFYFPTNDIALVTVNEEWNYTSNVDFIQIARRTIDYSKNCITSGYGAVGASALDAISPVLLLARIDVMTRWRCTVLWEMNMDTFICTDSKVTDVSRGDSGGPLSCPETSDPIEEPGKGLLVGIVSGKNYDKTTLYTRVSAYKDWIERGECCCVNNSITLLLSIQLVLLYIMFQLNRVSFN